MKQKYKVFINDKEIEFIPQLTSKANESEILSDELSHEEIVASVTGHISVDSQKFVVECVDPAKSFQKFTHHFRLIEAAGGLVINHNDENKILMIYRLGRWDLPKGKIDKGETNREAALREVEEETGIGDLTILYELQKTWHIYFHKSQWIMKLTHWFLMSSQEKRNPEPQESEGITEARWISKEELKMILPLSYSSIKNLIEEEILNNMMNPGI